MHARGASTLPLSYPASQLPRLSVFQILLTEQSEFLFGSSTQFFRQIGIFFFFFSLVVFLGYVLASSSSVESLDIATDQICTNHIANSKLSNSDVPCIHPLSQEACLNVARQNRRRDL